MGKAIGIDDIFGAYEEMMGASTIHGGPERRDRPGEIEKTDRVAIGCLILSVLIAFAPTYVKLIQGPWRTEQEGHGPLIIMASGWLAWQCRARVNSAAFRPAQIAGWSILLMGLAILIVTRSQDVTMLEVASQLPILIGCILLVAGWPMLRIFAFPLAFLIFSIPPPGWLMDAFTVPLKAAVSDRMTELLYGLDYPVAQNGVMIMIGSYELMVKDACAGMNSIFALSAIGVFYIHEFALNSGPRSILLMMSIIPITILANFARVMALVLIAYYTGVDSIEGVFHDLTGFALFVVALAMFFLLDATCLGIAAIARFMLARGGRRPAFVGSIAPPVAANGTSGASGDALRDPSSL